MMEGETEGAKPLIEDVIFYGILSPQKLNLEGLTKQTPKVGVLMHFTEHGPVFNVGEDQGFEMWAFPDGIKIYDHNLQVVNDEQPEYSFGEQHSAGLGEGDHPRNYIYNFVHTDYSLNRTYFSALCWHEKRYIPLREEKENSLQANIYANSLPKCTLWELQNDPGLNDKHRTLVYTPQVVILGSKLPLFLFHRQMLKLFYINFLTERSVPVFNAAAMDYFKDLVYVAGYPLAEKEFDRTLLDIKKSEYQEISKVNIDSFYLSMFFLPKINEEGRQIQLVNLKHPSIQLIGVETGVGRCFSRPNVDLLRIVRKVGTINLINMWKSLLLQRHILVFSMNNQDIVDLFESLLYLIEPVRWQNIYIPFLPFHLASNIDAIQSYLIGISKIHMDYVIDHYPHQMKDVVLFDLDENLLLENTSTPINLPESLVSLMETRLMCLGFKKDSIFSSFFREHNECMTDPEKVFRVKSIFFDALIYLLNNYRPFASLREENLLSFDREGYKAIFEDTQWKQFASQLTETMIFVRLCEYHLDEEKKLRWNQSNFGGLFVYCQNIIQQKHRGSQFWSVPECKKRTFKWQSVPYSDYLEYMLQKDLSALKSKQVYNVENYLVKYICLAEMQEIQDTSGLSLYYRGNSRREKTFLKSVLEFLVPWIKDLQVERAGQRQHWVQLKVRVMEVMNLESLFGHMKTNRSLENRLPAHLREELMSYRMRKRQLMPIERGKAGHRGGCNRASV